MGRTVLWRKGKLRDRKARWRTFDSEQQQKALNFTQARFNGQDQMFTVSLAMGPGLPRAHRPHGERCVNGALWGPEKFFISRTELSRFPCPSN